jgi:uncharacterized protein (UPF0333 family)|tara:strand:+ start:220 stop:729 length:510 start_codon:yes stop_codon:yes gene_type:complete
MLLPPITFIITRVISNNLALSLGMIGALSIIRFRNPVKNPLELVIFFALITCGISYGVSLEWGILLLLIILIVLIFSKFFEFLIKKFKISNLFKYSFSTNDGNLKSIVEVEANEKNEFLENHDFLIYQSVNNNRYFYKISFQDRSIIKSFKERISNDKTIVTIDIRYGD